ncbi:MAG TPA: hypothetical protein DEA08_02855, partial [Planctomycetes bacterium]|nr:hypothetical protein [Planctomycetota bacterium]
MSKKRRDKLMKDWEHVSHEDFVRWLDASGLSQAELSRELGVSKVTISNWKAGRRVPKESRQKQLAAVVAEGQRRSTFDKERFRAWRKAQGLTQKELAERLGVSVGS